MIRGYGSETHRGHNTFFVQTYLNQKAMETTTTREKIFAKLRALECVKIGRVSQKTVRAILNAYADYPLYIRKGFAFKGARESLEDKETKPTVCPGGIKMMTFEERMQQIYGHYVAFDIDIDNVKKELHINAFSANDME